MLTIRRRNLSHRTRNGYTRASQTDEQREARIEAERMKMLPLTPIELHSIITWKSITVHSKSLLMDQ